MDSSFVRERITQLRLQKKVSEHKMSLELGQGHGYIHMIASGQALPSLKALFNICEYFDITPAEFFQPEPVVSPVQREALDAMEKLTLQEQEAVVCLLKRLTRE